MAPHFATIDGHAIICVSLISSWFVVEARTEQVLLSPITAFARLHGESRGFCEVAARIESIATALKPD